MSGNGLPAANCMYTRNHYAFYEHSVATIFCCGEAIVTPGINTCNGVENGSCTFTIAQNLCVAVPVEFGTVTTVGSLSVQCGEATSEDICTDC